jgi:3-dehydroquinate dehydratase
MTLSSKWLTHLHQADKLLLVTIRTQPEGGAFQGDAARIKQNIRGC